VIERDTKRLGSFGLWLWVRGIESLVLAVALQALLQLVRSRGASFFDVLSALLFAYLLAEFHCFAYGLADGSGISYRRYFKRKFVPWSDVAAVEWRPRFSFALVTLTLEDHKTMKKRLEFALNPRISEAFQVLSRKTRPHIVGWLEDRIQSRQKGIPPEDHAERVPFWRKTGFIFYVALFFLALGYLWWSRRL